VVFRAGSCRAARLSRRVGGVPRPLVVSFPGRSGGCGCSAGGQGLQAGDGGGDVVGPGPALGEAQAQAAAAAHDPAGGGEQAQAEPFGFPAAGGPGQGEQLRPGQQFAGQGDDLAPELVLGEALEGYL
jgi:hypothetical protein